MKRKFISVLLCLALATTLLGGCGSSTKTSSDSSSTTTKEDTDVASDEKDADADADAVAEAEAEATEEPLVNTVGPDSGTKMQLWTFVELHSNFYASAS